MVVCSSTPMPVQTSAYPIPPPPCQITPAAFPQFAPAPYSTLPSIISCTTQIPQSTILTLPAAPSSASTPMSCAPCISTPPFIPVATAPSPQTSPSSSGSSSINGCIDVALPSNVPVTNTVVPTNGSAVITYTQVPTNVPLVPFPSNFTFVPCNQTLQCKVPTNPAVAPVSTFVPCSETICSSNLPTTSIVPYQQRIDNGPMYSRYQCTPGVCHVPPAVYSTGTVEVCSLPNGSIIPSNTTFYSAMPSIAQNIYPPIVSRSEWKQSYGMEHHWQDTYRQLFTKYLPHAWDLIPVDAAPTGSWHSSVDSAKVRFCCEDCGHGWTSMKGRVAFWFFLNSLCSVGTVCMKLYGQQCEECKSGKYESSMWYPEEVEKVLYNICQRVGEVYYGYPPVPYHKERRAGKPRTPHNSDLCQACKDGVCAERR